MGKYFYPKGVHGERLKDKAKKYIEKHPDHSINQIQAGISEKVSNTQRRTISKAKIKNIIQKHKKEKGKPIYSVNGRLSIVQYPPYPPEEIATDHLRIVNKFFYNKSSARKFYNELLQEYNFEIAEYLGYPDIQIREATLTLSKVIWYGNKKEFKIIDKMIWDNIYY